MEEDVLPGIRDVWLEIREKSPESGILNLGGVHD